MEAELTEEELKAIDDYDKRESGEFQEFKNKDNK